jgi:protoheme IX farnesyltransferase
MSMKASSSSKLRTYYRLTKPGIIYGNVMTTLAGFLFAGTWSRGSFDIVLLLATVCGTSLVIASACVANNYIDQDIDRTMERTKKRALVMGDISGRSAIIFSIVLGITGFGLLLGLVNVLTAAAGAVAFIFYVVLYGWSTVPWWVACQAPYQS